MGEIVAGFEAHGDRPAIVEPDGSTTSYRDLLGEAYRLAHALGRYGLEPGDRFAFLLPNGLRIVHCYLACATAGFVGVPLAARLTIDEFEHQLRETRTNVLLHHPSASAIVAALRERLPDMRAIVDDDSSGGDGLPTALASASSELPAYQPAGEDAMCVMFTGGTTGASKAAALTQVGWGCCVVDTVEQLGLKADDRHAVVLPMTHAAWFTLAAHLHVGAVTHIMERWDPTQYRQLIERERLTTLHMIPTLLGDLLTVAAEHDVSSARLLTVAGSPMPIEMYRQARELFGDILGNIYGLTEATGPVSYLLPADMSDAKIRSGGRVGQFFEIEIFDAEPSTQPDAGQVRLGEIALRGPQMMAGYLNRPEETAAALRDGWFTTGDIGFVDEDGFLFILDRKKDMIKSGGFNVYPKEVEEVLYRHPRVTEAAVIGVPDPKWIEAVVAVVAADVEELDTAELQGYCREELAAYKVPKTIHVVDALPRTAFGKFDKKALQQRFGQVPGVAAP